MTVNEIVTYVMSNPANTNYSVARAMLEELLGDNPNVDTVLDYVLTTPANTNYSVLKMWLEVLNGETPSPTPDPDPDPDDPDEPDVPNPEPAVLTIVNAANPAPGYGISSINFGDSIISIPADTSTYDIQTGDEFTITYAPGDQFTARYHLEYTSGISLISHVSEGTSKFKMIDTSGSITYAADHDGNPDDDNPTS